MLKIWITLVMTVLCGSFAFAGDGGNYCDEAEEAMWGNNAFNTGNATNSGYEMPNEDACPDQFLDWGDSPDRWIWFVPDVDEINLHTCQSGSYDTSLVVYEGDDCLSLVQELCLEDTSVGAIGFRHSARSIWR